MILKTTGDGEALVPGRRETPETRTIRLRRNVRIQGYGHAAEGSLLLAGRDLDLPTAYDLVRGGSARWADPHEVQVETATTEPPETAVRRKGGGRKRKDE